MIHVTLIFSCLFFLAGPTSAETASARKLLDRELLTIYGAIVRSNYQNKTTLGTSTFQFLELEAELEQRGLLSGGNYNAIERGLIDLRTPLLQLYAVVDGFQEVELVSFPPHMLQRFQGSEMPDPRFGDRRTFKPTFLACNGKLIGFMVSGLTTIDTYYSVEQSNSTAQTNFETGFLEKNSRYMRPWLERGRLWKTKQILSVGARGHRSYIFNVSAENGSLQRLIDERLEQGKYPQIKRYFDSVC